MIGTIPNHDVEGMSLRTKGLSLFDSPSLSRNPSFFLEWKLWCFFLELSVLPSHPGLLGI
jgi:hypothetical protein